jgi:hypothetical protein
MFERYRPGTNPIIDVIAGSYERAREMSQALDVCGAFGIDRLRRRRRMLQRVERLDTSIGETISTLAELETETDGPAAANLSDARSQLQWVLTQLRS